MKTMKKWGVLLGVFALLTFGLVGCGGVNSATDANNQTDTDTNGTDDTDSVGDDIGDAAEDVGDAVGDVAEGAGDAVADLIDGTDGFDNYDDAHDYLLQRLGMKDTNANYEVRDENRELVSYDDTNEGYQFEIYDTSQNTDGEHKGTYYVDSKTGKVYRRKADDDTLKEVDVSVDTTGSTVDDTANQNTNTDTTNTTNTQN
jgi:uncharacterized protein (DUF2147 family)